MVEITIQKLNEADITNKPTLNLYRKYGFKEKNTQEYYAWKVE